MLNNLIFIIPELYIVNILIILLTYISFFKNTVKNNLNIITISLISLIILSLIILKYTSFTNEFLILNEIINFNKLNNYSKLLITVISIFIFMNSFINIKNKEIEVNEYTLILLSSVLGMFVLISGNDLLIIYLAIELYSLPLYVLASIKRWSQKGTEAALKYFVIGSLASGLYLFGTSIIYILLGSIKLNDIAIIFNSLDHYNIILFSFIIILCAIFIKIAAAPFHMWAPDVYDGAPLIITNIFSTLPKVTLIILLYNFIIKLTVLINYSIKDILIFVAILSIIIGSVAGINQNKLKRLLAFSSISHVGFILLPLINFNYDGINNTFIYLILYTIGTVGLFSVAFILIKDQDYLYNFKGFSKYNKWASFSLVILLFSAAGVPPLSGFIIKYLIIIDFLKNGNLIYAVIALICSVISLIYYIRIIKIMYFKDTTNFNNKLILDIIKTKENYSTISSLVIGVSLYISMTFIIYPNLWIKLINYSLL